MSAASNSTIAIRANYVSFSERSYLNKNGEKVTSPTVTFHLPEDRKVEYTTEGGEVVMREAFTFFKSDVMRFVHLANGTRFVEKIKKSEDPEGFEEQMFTMLELNIILEVGKTKIESVTFDKELLELFEQSNNSFMAKFKALAQ